LTSIADLKGAIRTILLADTGVTAIVGSRIFTPWLPQVAAYPCITQSVMDHRENINIDSCMTVLRITSWAKDSGNDSGDRIATDLAKVVQHALYGKRGEISIIRPDRTSHSVAIRWIEYDGGIPLYDVDDKLAYVNDRFRVTYRGD
jgi:hypothetical protein